MWYQVISGSTRKNPFLFTQAVPIASASHNQHFCSTPSLGFVLGNLNYTKIQILIPQRPRIICSNICSSFFLSIPTFPPSIPCKHYVTFLGPNATLSSSRRTVFIYTHGKKNPPSPHSEGLIIPNSWWLLTTQTISILPQRSSEKSVHCLRPHMFWYFSVNILDIQTGVPTINANVKYISELHQKIQTTAATGWIHLLWILMHPLELNINT